MRERYISKFEEAFKPMTPEEKEQKIKDIIDRLKNEDFGNKEQRGAMGSMMMALVRASNGGNKEARKYLKELGKILSNWGNGNFDKEDEPEEEKEEIEETSVEEKPEKIEEK